MHGKKMLLRRPIPLRMAAKTHYATGTRVLLHVAGADIEGSLVEDLGTSGPNGDHIVRVRIPVDPQYGEDHVVDLPAEFIIKVLGEKPRRRRSRGRVASAQTPTP